MSGGKHSSGETCGKTSFQSAKAGEQFPLLVCKAKARMKGVLVSETPVPVRILLRRGRPGAGGRREADASWHRLQLAAGRVARVEVHEDLARGVP